MHKQIRDWEWKACTVDRYLLMFPYGVDGLACSSEADTRVCPQHKENEYNTESTRTEGWKYD